MIFYLIKKGIISLKKNGIKFTYKKLISYINRKKHISSLSKHIHLNNSEKLFQYNTKFPKNIKISIITPLYNTPRKFLIKMIDSVIAQTYYNWELCLADGSDIQHEYVKNICNDYSNKDKRIIYKKLEKNEGISDNTNIAIDMSSGDYLGLLDHDDLLHPSALYEVIKVICYEYADFIYSDEATFINDTIILKHFKPDFAIDTLLSGNYICHFSIFSRKLMEQAGKLRSDYNGSQDYDLILRYTDIAKKIIHIPKILYFWRSHKNSTAFYIDSKLYTINAGKNAIIDHLERQGISAKVESTKICSLLYRIKYDLIDNPVVSIIILNKDNISILKKCIHSIIEKTTYNNYEIIIVENNSIKEETFNYYDELKIFNNINIIFWTEKYFNYSILNNFALQYSNGTHLLFLNNDIEIITPGWIEEMLMYSQRDNVGAVGVKLLFPDNTIQHAGVILNLHGLAGHIFSRALQNVDGYMGRLHFVQNMSVVTAACMMIKKAIFKEVGQFSTEFFASWSDVDLCLKLRSAGYLNVWTPHAEAYHHESKTRGYPNTLEKKRIFEQEITLFKEKWGKVLEAGDPYYNPNFSLNRSDYSLK